MDESQEELLKRLALLKQKIREQYPELSDKMSMEHLENLKINKDSLKDHDNDKCLVTIHKNTRS